MLNGYLLDQRTTAGAACAVCLISLAHSLQLKVFAEGVDDEEQAKILRLLRCDMMQGYLLSRPAPFDAITVMLRGRNIPVSQPA